MSRALTAAEIEIFATIVRSLDEAIFSQDENGFITSWNLGAEKLFGYTSAEALGQSICLSDPAHPDDISSFIKLVSQSDGTEHYETVRSRKNGEKINIWLTVSPIYDPSGKLIGSASIARDITFQKQLQVDRQF